MKAMILAAGRGERLRPLTDNLPKPLVPAVGKPLLFYHLERLAAAGVQEVVINTAYLGDKIQVAVGDGSQWQLSVRYSSEPEPLETGGALQQALPLLGEAPFLLINGDIWTDYPLQPLLDHRLHNHLAHLILVNNPDHHPEGDFGLGSAHPVATLQAKTPQSQGFTFSGMSIIDPKIITQYPKCRPQFPLGEVFRHYLQASQITAEVYKGQWFDIGTVERLRTLEAYIVSGRHTK